MTFLYGSAREWADEHSLAAPVRFGRLEATAFQRHPEIVEHLGVDGATMAEQQRSRQPSLRKRLGVVLLVIIVIGAVAPVVGVAILSGDRFNFFRIEAQRSVPGAGIAYGIGAAAQVAFLVAWLRSGARFTWVGAGVALVAAFMATGSLIGMPATAELDGFAEWEPWYPPVIACLVVALVFAIAQFARFRHRDPEGDGPAPSASDATEADVAALIAALPEDERRAILDDRDGALAVLHDRGLIDDERLAAALAQPPGTLHRLDATPAF